MILRSEGGGVVESRNAATSTETVMRASDTEDAFFTPLFSSSVLMVSPRSAPCCMIWAASVVFFRKTYTSTFMSSDIARETISLPPLPPPLPLFLSPDAVVLAEIKEIFIQPAALPSSSDILATI